MATEPDEQDEPAHVQRKAIIRQSGFAGIAAAVAVGAGIVFDAVIALRYGAGASSDAFFVGARIAVGIQTVLTVASNQALVPQISGWLVQHGLRETRRNVSALAVAAALAGLAVAIVLAALSWPLVRLTAPGLSALQADAAVRVAVIMAFVIPLEAIDDVFEGYLNARYSFVVPSGIKVVRNLASAGIIFVFADSADPTTIAWAYLAGMVLQALVAWIAARRREFKFTAPFHLRNPAVADTARLCIRPVAGASINPLARIGEQFFVSFLPPGSITILNYGNRLISAVGGTVFFRSIVVTLVPRMTRAWRRGAQDDLARLTRTGNRIMIFVALPLTAVTAVLAQPAMLAVFRRGKFSAADASLLGATLAVYAASLLGSGVQRSMLAPFFATLDTSTPLRNTIYGNLANLALIAPCIWLFDSAGANPLLGVAAAYSLAEYVHVGHAWYRLHTGLHISLRGLTRSFIEAAIGSALLAIVLIGLSRLLGLNSGDLTRIQLLIRTGLAGAIALVPSGAIVILMRRRQRRDDTATGAGDQDDIEPGEMATPPIGGEGAGLDDPWDDLPSPISPPDRGTAGSPEREQGATGPALPPNPLPDRGTAGSPEREQGATGPALPPNPLPDRGTAGSPERERGATGPALPPNPLPQPVMPTGPVPPDPPRPDYPPVTPDSPPSPGEWRATGPTSPPEPG